MLTTSNVYSNNCVTDGTERTIFVSGLNYKTTETEIAEFFNRCGEIE